MQLPRNRRDSATTTSTTSRHEGMKKEKGRFFTLGIRALTRRYRGYQLIERLLWIDLIAIRFDLIRLDKHTSCYASFWESDPSNQRPDWRQGRIKHCSIYGGIALVLNIEFLLSRDERVYGTGTGLSMGTDKAFGSRITHTPFRIF
jgi:hypothetical protein